MNGNNRFHLVFGMTDTETRTAHMSAKWIHTIYIELGGTPPKNNDGSSGNNNASLDGSEKGGSSANSDENSSEGDELKDESDGKKRDAKSNRTASSGESTNSGNGFSVTYDANGGTGAPVDNRNYSNGDRVTVLGKANMKRAERAFIGWARSRTAPVEYRSGDSFRINANTTLYAVWDSGALQNLQNVSAAGLVALDVGADEGGLQPWRVHEIAEDAQPKAAPPQNDSMIWPTLIAMMSCLLFGAGLEFIRYRRDIRVQYQL
jgi:hypothetical protein